MNIFPLTVSSEIQVLEFRGVFFSVFCCCFVFSCFINVLKINLLDYSLTFLYIPVISCQMNFSEVKLDGIPEGTPYNGQYGEAPRERSRQFQGGGI